MQQVKFKRNLPMKKTIYISTSKVTASRIHSLAKSIARINQNRPTIAKPKKRLGIAKGKFTIPEDFDRWDDEIADLFGES